MEIIIQLVPRSHRKLAVIALLTYCLLLELVSFRVRHTWYITQDEDPDSGYIPRMSQQSTTLFILIFGMADRIAPFGMAD